MKCEKCKNSISKSKTIKEEDIIITCNFAYCKKYDVELMTYMDSQDNSKFIIQVPDQCINDQKIKRMKEILS